MTHILKVSALNKKGFKSIYEITSDNHVKWTVSKTRRRSTEL